MPIQRADVAETTLLTRGVRVVSRRGVDDNVAMITGAALAALLAIVLLKKG